MPETARVNGRGDVPVVDYSSGVCLRVKVPYGAKSDLSTLPGDVRTSLESEHGEGIWFVGKNGRYNFLTGGVVGLLDIYPLHPFGSDILVSLAVYGKPSKAFEPVRKVAGIPQDGKAAEC